MPVARHHHLTLADYFSAERQSPSRHEYADGVIWVMGGGSPRHNYVAARVHDALTRGVGTGPCFTMTADQRISTADGLYTYADGSVFCGSMTLGADQTAANPVVLVEVLSDSTRTYDRGEKLDRYRTIPSLRHVLLVEVDAPDVEVWTRGDDGSWTRAVHVALTDSVRLGAIDVALPVADLYAGIERIPAA
jgi:Uma2 family endonuclease